MAWNLRELKSDKDGTYIVATIERDDYGESLDFEAVEFHTFVDENEVRDRLPLILKDKNAADAKREELERKCEALRAEFGLDGAATAAR